MFVLFNRNELASQTKAAISEAEVGGIWESHGRACCPRLLFHFRRAPTPLRKNPTALKKLEHAVEDQLYFMLRKTRIITNVWSVMCDDRIDLNIKYLSHYIVVYYKY